MGTIIHHYTNIDVLALILKNRTLRFTRLDQVDDKEESNFVCNGVNLGPYTFISCWTESKEESIPMWKMYTKEKWGVRLSFEKEGMFKTYIEDVREHNGVRISKAEPIISLIPPEERWSQKDYIPPIVTEDYDGCNFYRKIDYVDDIKPYANNSVIINAKNNTLGITVNTDKVGRYKHKRWSFQEESRFVLFFMPGNPLALVNDKNYFMEHKRMINEVINNKKLDFSYYYMCLSEEAFDHLVITVSPLCDEAQWTIVEALRDKYAPNAKVQKSNLTGKLAK